MSAAPVSHLYRPGERVVLDLRAGYFLKSDSAFTVVAQMPPLGNEFQYRVKSVGEPYERVVLEHQLTRAAPRDAAGAGFFKERDMQTI
jgi:hypothetical protein